MSLLCHFAIISPPVECKNVVLEINFEAFQVRELNGLMREHNTLFSHNMSPLSRLLIFDGKRRVSISISTVCPFDAASPTMNIHSVHIQHCYYQGKHSI